ncbi:hypothetical protein SETIT_4G271400v2 [Setaria italica]|uniref:histone acetyltransferase n=3 Tax=Setaria italica TaxID=4555 RepID=A0A368QZ64_SETIT|nr:hypothetical protein SETIT_4G271400v2 [Setaria italica]
MNVSGQMSGQPVQMNLGGGRGLQQHQPLQVASRYPDMDHQFSKMRSAMHRNIVDHLMKMMKIAENQSLGKLADRLEEVLYRLHPTKVDYYVMLKGPIEPHLQGAIKVLSRHGNQHQQMSHQTPTPSHCGTMVPTPGSMSNGYQDPSINVLQNSMATSDSSVMCPVNTQRQVAHMIPAPGFSGHQILPSNPVYPCGAGYLNGELNVIPQVHEQKPMPFSINQGSYPMQHVGTHVGFGVHSRMLEDSSSNGLSGPQINGDIGFPGSNMQLSYGTVAAKEFTNIPPYGNSPEKLLQQEFICHPPKGTPTSAFVSGNLHGTVSSTLKPIGNQMNAANTLPTSRMECALLTSQTTKQSLQPKPVIKAEVLDQTENVIFTKSQLPYQHQQQHYFEPNRPCSQFVKGSHLGSCCDEQLSNQGALPYNELMYSKATEDNDKSDQMYRQYVSHNNIQITSGSQQLLSSHAKNTELISSMFQRPMSQDATEQHVSSDWPNAGCAMTPIDHKPPKLPTRGSERATNKYDLQTLRLIKFIHAKISPCPLGGSCKSPICARLQEILKHSNDCQTIDCLYGYCKQSKEAIYHYNNCVNKHCPICSKAKSLSHYCDQTNKRNTFERSINGANGDRMGINMVTAETFDDQPPMSKRLRLQLLPPNVSHSADASVPQACTGIVSQQAHPKHLGQDKMIFPKQEQNIEIDIQSPRKVEIIRSCAVGKTGAIQTYVVPDVSNELDSYIEKKNCLSDKDTNEIVVDIKNNANGSTDAMMSKIEKTKRKGVSLMELFTPEQIHEHVRSLRQWVGQSKAKAEKNQVIGHSKNVNSCQLCKVEKLFFEPPPKYCSPCGARIKRNAPYYSDTVTESGPYYFCIPCYSESRSDSILVDNIQLLKSKLVKNRNDDELEEAWVACDKCKRWQHQICALFNAKRNDEEKDAEYICHSCYIQEIEHGLRMPLPLNTVPGAKDLPRTVLSDHIEERLLQRLKEERQNRANKYGKNFSEVPGAEGLVVRVVSSVDKKLKVKPHFLEIFREDNYPAEFPYKSKAILLFQRIEGVEVCLFGIYVQEFGAECAFPNQRRVYLSYLDSVKYFRPEIETVSGEALRTFVYHEILIGYLQYCKQRGFTSCYIWACPPFKGEDYIMYCHPEIQKTPKSDKLREWYLSMLRKATNEGIVVELTNLYEHFFNPKTECKAKVTAARLPYFDGDYWPGAAEDIINQIRLPEDDRNLQKKGKLKKTITKRALKFAGLTNLNGNASKDAMLMQKLGEAIYPMKEDLIMVHLQHSCHHCCILIVSGRRWVCSQCKSFYICDKCYNVEEQREAKERHPSNSTDFHILHPVEIDGVPKDTKDRDGILESEFFDTRQAFLSLCQGNHYQYDTLRGAKHSSMMVLYHLHNPTEPAFVTTCDVCKNNIKTGQGWRCKECDYDECVACYKHNEGANHVHKLTKQPTGADMDTHQKKSAETTQMLLRLLAHAGSCPGRGGCQYHNCRKLKSLFHHGTQCKTRSSGGCRLCKKLWGLITLHARGCKESQCNIPRCRDTKEYWRKLQLMQWQSESRRRAAVNQMMMQRQLETSSRAAGNGVNV